MPAPNSRKKLTRSYRNDWETLRPAIFSLLQECQHAAEDLECLGRLQDERLQTMVRSAFRNCLFYRRNYEAEQVEEFRGLENLAQLPLLSRAQLQDNLEEIAATGLKDFSDCTSYSSSGSTGEPITVVRSRQAMLLDSALLRLILTRHGVEHQFRPTRPSLFFLLQNTWSLEERMPMLSMGRFYRFPIGPPTWDSPEHLLGFLMSHPGVPLSSNPQSLTQFLDLCQTVDPKRNFKIRPSLVMSGGAELSDHLRDSLAVFFEAPIVNLYATVEAGLVGIQCPQSPALHVESTSLVECLDDQGKPVPPGEVGELVISNLTNPKFPILRYRIGDFGILAQEQCRCGSVLPRITSLMGRTNTLFTTRDGHKIVPATLNRDLRKLPVYQYQLEQRSVDCFVLRYREIADSDSAAIQIAVQAALSEQFGAVSVDCQVSKSLGAEGKKVQAFICTMPS